MNPALWPPERNIVLLLAILHFELKETTFEFGYFLAMFGVFFANHIEIFHKAVVLMVILR